MISVGFENPWFFVAFRCYVVLWLYSLQYLPNFCFIGISNAYNGLESSLLLVASWQLASRVGCLFLKWFFCIIDKMRQKWPNFLTASAWNLPMLELVSENLRMLQVPPAMALSSVIFLLPPTKKRKLFVGNWMSELVLWRWLQSIRLCAGK